MQLSGPSIIPTMSTSAVILLHGYGANGSDLISIGEDLSSDFSQTAFFAPNASTEIFSQGYEWFSLNDYNPQQLTLDYLNVLQKRAMYQVDLVKNYILNVVETCHIPLDKIIIGGFSQGGLMAFLTAYSMSEKCAGVMGLSAVPLVQPVPCCFSMPVLLTHGGLDLVVPPIAMNISKDTLEKMKQPVQTFCSKRMEHNIDKACLDQIRLFLKKRF